MDDATTPPSPIGTPADTPLRNVVDRIDSRIGEGQFGAIEGGSVRCFTCRHTFGADLVDADRVARLEGASDPADMVMVVPVVCPECGAGGSLVLHYGPAASVEESDVLGALDRRVNRSS